MSQFATVTSSTSTITLTAAGAVASGDLVTINDAGWVSPARGIANLDYQTGGFGTYTSQLPSFSGVSNLGLNCIGTADNMAALADGATFVQLSTVSGLNQLWFYLATLNSAGAPTYGTPVMVTNASFTSTNWATVVPLTGGGFAVLWTITTANTVWYAIYDATGTQTKAATQAGTTTYTTATTGYAFGVAPTIAGGFVFAGQTGSSTLVGGVYNAAGTAIAADIALGATATSTQGVALKSLSNGDIIVHWISASTTVPYFTRLNASGVVQGTAATALGAAGTGSPQTSGTCRQRIGDLGSGVCLLTIKNAGGAWFDVIKIAANNSFTTAWTGTSGTTTFLTQLDAAFSARADGAPGLALHWQWTATQIGYCYFDASGAPGFTGATGTLTTGNTHRGLTVAVAAGGYFISRTAYDGTSAYTLLAVRLAHATATGTIAAQSAGTVAGLGSSSAASFGQVFALASNLSLMVFLHNGLTSVNGVTYVLTMQGVRSSVLGVAQSAAAAGATFQLAIAGTFSLPSYQNYTGVTTTARSNGLVPGNLAVLIGRGAVLNGLVAPNT